ncbi:MAG: hypothetical protein M3R53_00800 [Candidatus Eremiobacteraeota bacterium]|nr:hypothetical protein [Candidatus Eremiobacteraeota bacterium]
MVDTILMVHGYSVRTLNSWGRLPALLQADGFAAAAIYLSAFVSLDDYVSCDDLAAALEDQIATLEAQGLKLATTALVAHSTGAIIARRWMLNRRTLDKPSLSHFISCAGANHGSTLAQLGRGELARLFRGLTQDSSVGRRVLADLDYGSDFLRHLNKEWLDAWNDARAPLYRDTFCFSMGGTDHSFWENHLAWQSREAGSDGTVRIASANLNYRIISVTPPYTTLTTSLLSRPAPHLIVQEPNNIYSHTSQAKQDTLGLVMSSAENAVNTITHFGGNPEPVSSSASGILEGIVSPDERPYRALKEAISVVDEASYGVVAQRWNAESATWTDGNVDQACSTIVVAMHDANDRLVDDSLVLIRDGEGGTIGGVASSVLTNQPIRNELDPSVISVYVNWAAFHDVHPHSIYAEAKTDSAYVAYDLKIDAPLSDGSDPHSHVIAPNEFTYVDVTTSRNARAAFKFYSASDPKLTGILNTAYPPFP